MATQVQVTSRSFNEIANTLSELETLTSQAGSLSAKDAARNSFLLAKLSLLRQGVDVSELRNFAVSISSMFRTMKAAISLPLSSE